MCGITGIIGPKNEEVVKKMAEAIRHRGPDDDGFYSDDLVSLGMRRLSIIDVSGGSQPIESSNGRYLIFFNGEIYNYKEIKKELGEYQFKTASDTEVVLAGYEKWGSEVLGKLRGMFAFAIYDKVEGKVFLARDYFGIKPLYFLLDESSGAVKAFSSEIKSFFTVPDFRPEVSDEAVFNYLSFQYNPCDETFLKGVFKLPPAHFMIINAKTGATKSGRYWRFKFERDETLDESQAKAEILETMRDSVEHHMIADVPVGSFLSGGIDSSIIATLMSQRLAELGSGSRPNVSRQKVKTFTVGFGSVSEGPEAKETSDPLGTDHREIRVGAREYFQALPSVAWHFDEPVADPSAVGLYFLAKEASKHVKVVLSGEGSDELFGGYNIYLEPFARRKISWLPRPLLKILASLPLRGRNYARRALLSIEESYIGNAKIFGDDEIEKLWRGESQNTFNLSLMFAQVKRFSDSVKMQYIDIHTWLIGDILAKADKMTMAHSLELRVPFLDIKVASLAERLPDNLKWRGSTTKYALREAFKEILPESARTRRKLGFPTPVRDWFREADREIFNIIYDNTYIQSHMDLSYIRKIVEDHVVGKSDNSRKIYLLLMLAIWYNVFIGGLSPREVSSLMKSHKF